MVLKTYECLVLDIISYHSTLYISIIHYPVVMFGVHCSLFFLHRSQMRCAKCPTSRMHACKLVRMCNVLLVYISESRLCLPWGPIETVLLSRIVIVFVSMCSYPMNKIDALECRRRTMCKQSENLRNTDEVLLLYFCRE